MRTEKIEAYKEGNATGNDAREGELVCFRDGVYFTTWAADTDIPIPKAIKKLDAMNYEVGGITIYKERVRLLLIPKRAKPKQQTNPNRKARFAAYMRRRYWLEKHGCEPPEKKGEQGGIK